MKGMVIGGPGRYRIRVQSPSGIWVTLDGYCDTSAFAEKYIIELGYTLTS